MKETQMETKARKAARESFLGCPDPAEGEAAMAEALASQGIPEPAAAKAAKAYAEALEESAEAWRPKMPKREFREDMAEISGTSDDAARLYRALVQQATERPHPTNWIRLDEPKARSMARLGGKPKSVYENALRELISRHRIALRVVGSNEPMTCFILLDQKEAA